MVQMSSHLTFIPRPLTLQPLTPRDIKIIKQQQKLLQKLQRKLDKEAEQRRKQEEKRRRREEAELRRKGKKSGKKDKYQVSNKMNAELAILFYDKSLLVVVETE